MSSPFLPGEQYAQGVNVGVPDAIIVVAGRNPSDTIDIQYPSGVLWLSDLAQGGSGSLFVQSGNQGGDPTWATLSSGSSGPLNTISDGTIVVSPSGSSNIAIEGTASQIVAVGSAAAHNIALSIPSNFIAPGAITSSTTMTVGTDLSVANSSTIGNDLSVTDDVSIGGDLAVTGAITFGASTIAGAVNLNITGNSNTTIGNAAGAGAILFNTPSGDFTLNGNANEIHIGDDASSNVIAIGSDTGAASMLLKVGTGDFLLTGATASTFTIGETSLTGLITVGNSTAGQDVSISDGVNVGAQVVSIGNGASAANSTVNILSGTGTAGVGVLALGNNPRVTTVGIANIAPLAARTTTMLGGNSAQNDTIAILGGNPSANSQIYNLLSGAATGGTQTINMFSGNSTGATQSFNLFTGTSAGAVNIGTGGTGVKTIAIGGDAANVITIANTQTGGSLAFGAAMTTGTVTIGGTGLQTGTVSLASGTGAQTVAIATGGTGVKTVNIGTGAIGNVITIGTVSAAASLSLLVGTGNFSLDGAATSNYTIAPSTTSGTINIGGTNANTGTMTIAGGTGAQTLNVAASTGVKTLNLATGAAANQVVIGTENTTAKLDLRAGSGAVNVFGNLNLVNVATKLSYKGGAVTDFIGRATLIAGTVTIANTNISASDRIFVTRSALNASPALGSPITTISAATSFTIASFNDSGVAAVTDVSTFDYVIVRQT